MFALLASVFLLLVPACKSAAPEAKRTETNAERKIAPEDDDVLMSLGQSVKTMSAEGTFSTTGTQNLSGLPFSSLMDTNDAFKLTMGGPFGITAAKMWAQRDTFVLVNYLLQQVHEGKLDSPSLKSTLPFPMPASQIVQLMRGKAPGDPKRFVRGPQRSDGTVLFTCQDTVGIEYLLVDTVGNYLKQYQRKNLAGELQLDVAFKEVKVEDGVLLPHVIDVAVENRKQTATFRLDNVVLNKPITETLAISIPPSFARTTYR